MSTLTSQVPISPEDTSSSKLKRAAVSDLIRSQTDTKRLSDKANSVVPKFSTKKPKNDDKNRVHITDNGDGTYDLNIVIPGKGVFSVAVSRLEP